MNHLEQTIKDLHQNFSGFEVFSNSETPMVRHHILVTNNYLRGLENLIIQSYIRFIESEIEDIRDMFQDERPVDCIDGVTPVETYGHEETYNDALKEVITHLTQLKEDYQSKLKEI